MAIAIQIRQHFLAQQAVIPDGEGMRGDFSHLRRLVSARIQAGPQSGIGAAARQMKLKGNVRLFAELFQCVQQFRDAFLPADLSGIDEAVRACRCRGIRLARKEDFVIIPGSDDGHLFRRKPAQISAAAEGVAALQSMMVFFWA